MSSIPDCSECGEYRKNLDDNYSFDEDCQFWFCRRCLSKILAPRIALAKALYDVERCKRMLRLCMNVREAVCPSCSLRWIGEAVRPHYDYCMVRKLLKADEEETI